MSTEAPNSFKFPESSGYAQTQEWLAEDFSQGTTTQDIALILEIGGFHHLFTTNPQMEQDKLFFSRIYSDVSPSVQTKAVIAENKNDTAVIVCTTLHLPNDTTHMLLQIMAGVAQRPPIIQRLEATMTEFGLPARQILGGQVIPVQLLPGTRDNLRQQIAQNTHLLKAIARLAGMKLSDTNALAEYFLLNFVDEIR